MFTSLSFCKLLPENPTNHIQEIPRKSKEMGASRIFLKFIESAWFVGFSGKIVKLEYSRISMKFQAYS